MDFQGIEAIVEALAAISSLSSSALWKGSKSLAFKKRAESITRLSINADLFMSRSNNVETTQTSKKTLAEFSSLKRRRELQHFPEPVAKAGLTQGKQLQSILLTAG